MKRHFFSAFVAFSASVLVGCAQSPVVTAPAPSLSSPMVTSMADVPAPASGTISQRDPVMAPHTATRLMRIAPGARMPQHHHAGYDETFILQEGGLVLTLDGKAYDVKRGDVVLIPAGVTISGQNGSAESMVVVVWSNNGTGHQLSTPGPAPAR